MSYMVKWKLIGETQTRQSPQTYAGPSQAIDFACTIFKQLPVEIWIEGPGGYASKGTQFSESAGVADHRDPDKRQSQTLLRLNRGNGCASI